MTTLPRRSATYWRLRYSLGVPGAVRRSGPRMVWRRLSDWAQDH